MGDVFMFRRLELHLRRPFCYQLIIFFLSGLKVIGHCIFKIIYKIIRIIIKNEFNIKIRKKHQNKLSKYIES